MQKETPPIGNKSSFTSLPMVILIIVLALAAIGIGAGLQSSSGSSQFACMSYQHQGSELVVSTSGIIHVSGSQYYVSCAEGNTDPTTPTTVSCLSITPQIKVSPYPDGTISISYYLSAPGHTITVPTESINSTEVLQPTTSTITVAC